MRIIRTRRYDVGMKRRTWIAGLVGVGVLGFGGWAAWRSSAHKAPQANRSLTPKTLSPEVQTFFDAQLPDLQKQPVSMREWLGTPLVLNFWASWCGPCVREMPALETLSTEIPQAKVLGVAIDSPDNVTKFLDKIPVTFPIYVAGHGGISLTKALGNTQGGLPFTVLINADGELVEAIKGEINPEVLESKIKQMLVS